MIGNGAHEYIVHTEKLCGEITVYSTHARELCIIRKMYKDAEMAMPKTT